MDLEKKNAELSGFNESFAKYFPFIVLNSLKPLESSI
jgi:hypothetical protein